MTVTVNTQRSREVVPYASRKNAAAIVVSYFPDTDFPARINLICGQFDYVIVVDNTSSESDALSGNAFSSDVLLLQNHRNLGIAAALNIGISKANELGCSWVVTFDQDSSILPGFSEQLFTIQTVLGDGRLLIGSNFFDENRGTSRFRCKVKSGIWQERKTVITSGMLLPVKLISEIGGFREDYFIDAVDHEFCLRARRAGYSVILACKPLMRHQIGRAFSIRLRRVGNFRPYSHPSFRKYYMVRNTCQTIKLYWRQEPIWCLQRIAALVLKLFFIATEDERKAQLTAFFSGLHDGLVGDLGKRQEHAYRE